ncbi:hypothetical protein C8250_012225 [Streptomyces sp. So13.3]|uniref:hypothetical protein n=1 Tax=Streptomyces TaxID=1883 RepID=UPI001107589C|nr:MULTISPECIES: hypothetical protein [Streptomyces]MCZ4096692.1 hypothetical protein [Streptomyces sp. H39-C1]QNA72576.1 hypothetical protein C8250_012225 [Streptomyces sp. So13.3]
MSRERLLKWLRRGALVTAVVLLVPVVAVAIALRLEYAGDPGAAGRTRGHDAVWLGHAWVDGRHTAADLEALRVQAQGTGIRDLYVHTGPLEQNGSLDPTLYPGAAWLIGEVHRILPGVRVQAWLGNVIAHHNGDDGLHLPDEATRARIQASGQQVLAAGFDGVHLDLEPNYSGDKDFLDILDRLRATTSAHGAALSVATHQIDPLPGLHTIALSMFDHPKWWSQKYFAEVARRVDQVAVMAYDSAMPLESLFGGYLAQQTALALEVTPAGTDLIMGLPGYHTSTSGHHPSAETVTAAVRGARLGLARHGKDREAFGMALYVDYAATPGDWAAYRSGWGGR